MIHRTNRDRNAPGGAWATSRRGLSRTAILLLAVTTGSIVDARAVPAPRADDSPALGLAWDKDILTIAGPNVPGGSIEVRYLEAYCRAGSTDRDWNETVIGHRTELVDRDPGGRTLKLRCTLNDGLIVDHVITAGVDEVDFRLTAHNPTATTSAAQWAQPCVRVDRFTGRGQDDYLPKCFVFRDGLPSRLPTEPWATRARYVPGQVWCPRHVDRNDVNPRPLSTIVPSNGLIGCYSADERSILATAWEPYQELFQGVIVCIHADLRLGGLKPGETKAIRGKLYVVPASIDALRQRYENDFPEHRANRSTRGG